MGVFLPYGGFGLRGSCAKGASVTGVYIKVVLLIMIHDVIVCIEKQGI